MESWEEKRILIVGKTYPSYSSKYTETACTGGLLDGTAEMVRLYPIPYRYLGETGRFKAFQWIRAKVRKSDDPRPESYRIDCESIELEELIDPRDAKTRRELLDSSPQRCRSVEELRKRYDEGGASLGVIRPKEILGCRLEKRPSAERTEWATKEKEVLSQQEMFGEQPKPLDFPEVYFKVKWLCDDPECGSHNMGLMSWGIHELYRRYSGDGAQERKVIDKMNAELDLSKRDVYMFLGSFRGRMFNFGLLDTYNPPREDQASLFRK